MRRWVWLPLLYVMIYCACADQRASAVTDVLRTVLEQPAVEVIDFSAATR